MSVDMLMKIADTLNVSASYLMGGAQTVLSGIVKMEDKICDILQPDKTIKTRPAETEPLDSFMEMNAAGQQKAVEQVVALAKAEAANIPDDTISDVNTNELVLFNEFFNLIGYYVRVKKDDLSGYYLGKQGEEEETFMSNKEFRALIKRVAAATTAMVKSEIELAKDDKSPK